MSETLVITEIDTQVIEVTATPNPVVEIVETAAAQVVEIAVEGPQGPPGPQGPKGDAGSDATHVHSQGGAAATWTINHALGKYPSVVVVDTSGEEVEGSVSYPSASQVVVAFSAPFSGKAYLN